MLSIIFFVVIIIGGIAALFHIVRKKSHRCRWCIVPTTLLPEVPEPAQTDIRNIIIREKMGASRIDEFETCTQCNRIYDWRWFNDDRVMRRDWDMHDRQCACGADLRRPAYADDVGKLREAMKNMHPEAQEYIKQNYPKDEIQDRLFSNIEEDHIFFYCKFCHRIYMWLPLEGTNYLAFQCVSKDYKKYDSAEDTRV